MENNRCFGCMKEKRNHPVCEHCGWDEGQQNLPLQLPTGTVLRDQYLIGKVLKQDSLFITYLGWDRYQEIPVIIREYYPVGMVSRNASDSHAVACYIGAEVYEENKEHLMGQGRELVKFRELKNIVQILSFFQENNTVYLVTEHSEGQTLRQYVKENGPMQLPQILQLLGPVMEDLQKLHEGNVIHREINPNQILIDDGGRARLLDFGAGALTDPDQENSGVIRSSEKFNSRFRPVEIYMPQGSLGAWTDVYSLCGTVCFCLNGRGPAAYADRSVAENPDEFIDVLPVTEKQKQVLRRGMAMKPRERTGSVAELLAELTESLQEHPKQSAHSPEVQHSQESLRRPDQQTEAQKCDKGNVSVSASSEKNRRKPWWLVAAAVAVVLAFVLLPLSRQSKPQSAEPPVIAATVPEATEAPTTTPEATAPSAAETSAKESENAKPAVSFSKDLVLKNFDPEGISGYAFGTDIKKSAVVSIAFLDSLENAPEDAVDVSETGNGKVLLWAEPVTGSIKKLFIAGEGKVYLPENSRYLFCSDSHRDTEHKDFVILNEIIFSNAVDTSHVVDMGWMFSSCERLKELDISNFDTSRVTDMEAMFLACSRLEELDVSNFDTSHVVYMRYMFNWCSGITQLDLGNFDTSQAIDMAYLFAGCENLEKLDVSSFDTSKVADMAGMFNGCRSLTELDLSGFDTSKVTDMSEMFGYCSGLTNLDVSSFDTSKVEDMSGMFSECSGLTSLDVSGFDISRVTRISHMFRCCFSLTENNLHTDNQKIIDQFRKDKSQ